MPAKLNTEKFILKAIEKNGDLYDYSQVKYINSEVKVEIICKVHGKFLSRPSDHLRGHGCPVCGNNIKLSKEDFIEKSINVHGNKYEYSLVDYNGNKSKVDIVCKIHGVFSQIPNSHLSGNGCPKCAKNFKSSTESFIIKAKLVHGDRYDYSKVNYLLGKSPVSIICKTHGEFTQVACNHLAGANCPTCTHEILSEERSMSFEEFLTKAKSRHKNFYDYSEAKYLTSNDPVTIICPLHGPFMQIAKTHLTGSGCQVCGLNSSGWNRTRFKNLVTKKGTGVLYVLRLYNEVEYFLKIGITTRKIEHRSNDFPYSSEIVHQEILTDGSLLFDLEKYLHKVFKRFKYKPNINFQGYTECFWKLSKEQITDEIKKFLSKEVKGGGQ